MLRSVNTALIALFSLILLNLATPLLAFPLNGDFERSYRGAPFAWEADHGWMFLPLNSHEGKGHVILREQFARAGSELMSSSFRLVRDGDIVSLSLAYRSSAPGAAVALVFCDALGRPLGERWEVPLQPADEWTEFRTQYEMGSLPQPEATAAVRAALLVQCEGIEVHVDDLKLDLAAPATTLPHRYPAVAVSPWSGATVLRAASRKIVADDSTDIDPGVRLLSLWLSNPVAVEATMPYQGRAEVGLEGDPGAEAFLLLRALGAAPSEVLWQTITPVAKDAHVAQPVTLAAPHITPSTMGLQAGLAVSADIPAAAVATDLYVAPVPLSLSLNGVQRKTEFETVEGAEVFVSAVNNTGDELATQALITVVDAAGATVHREQRAINVGPRSAASFSVKPKLPNPGSFVFRVSFQRNGVEVGTDEFHFAAGCVA